MRIIADKKDYYDCIMRAGQDFTVIYVRKPEEEIIGRKACNPWSDGWPFPRFRGRRGYDYIIGFCGKIYPMVEFEIVNRDDSTDRIKCFSMDEIEAFMVKHLSPREMKEYQGKARYSRWWPSLNRKSYATFFKECAEQQTKHEAMFTEKRCPVFVASEQGRRGGGGGVIEWNAMLNKHEFFRVFDPYTAFQEIAMFVGNLAIPQKPMPVIEDEMKIQTHGFDKFSFRHRKSETSG